MRRLRCVWQVAFAVLLALAPMFCSGVQAQIVVPNPVQGSDGQLNPNGQFRDPRLGGREHKGIDIAADIFTPVKAIKDGKVIINVTPEVRSSLVGDKYPKGGYRVAIEHADGTTSYYMHLLGYGQPKVGDIVKAGQTIGRVGRSGDVLPKNHTHLHFGIKKNGDWVQPILQGSPSGAGPLSRTNLDSTKNQGNGDSYLTFDENAPKNKTLGTTPTPTPGTTTVPKYTPPPSPRATPTPATALAQNSTGSLTAKAISNSQPNRNAQMASNIQNRANVGTGQPKGTSLANQSSAAPRSIANLSPSRLPRPSIRPSPLTKPASPHTGSGNSHISRSPARSSTSHNQQAGRR